MLSAVSTAFAGKWNTLRLIIPLYKSYNLLTDVRERLKHNHIPKKHYYVASYEYRIVYAGLPLPVISIHVDRKRKVI